MSRFDEWQPQLQHKKGSPANLRGIDVYHDFPWTDVVPHGMRQYSHGSRLAECALRRCGDKTPALILTSNEDEEEGWFETDTHHYVVVCLPRYLREATSDEAMAYLARRAEVHETQSKRAEELFSVQAVSDWLTADPARVDEVNQAHPSSGRIAPIDPAKAIAAFRKYWDAVAADPRLRSAFFQEDGAVTAFATWLAEHPVGAAEALAALESGSLARFDAAAGIARLQRFLKEWSENRENADEEAWQRLLTEESWALGQLFGSPFVIVRGKAYVGGKTFENAEGRITDFLFKNRLTGNALIVEIKTPVARLLGGQYRAQVYPASNDLAGGVAQALDQRRVLMDEGNGLGLEATGTVVLNPRTVLVIGDLERQDISGDKRRSFELLRGSLMGVDVVTFDELAEKAQDLLNLFQAVDA